MNWQRARTDEKKNERKDAIFSAALTLFKQKGFDGVSFNAIAAQAGFTKSNMYRYFSSKEEIFLNIFAALFEDWFNDIIQRLQTLEPNAQLDIFAEHYVESNAAYPEFLDLTPLMFTSLESNSSYEQLVEFKQLSMNLLGQIAAEVGRIYPALAGEKAFEFLTLTFAATANYWAAESKQNDALKRIYSQEPFIALKPNFKKSLTKSILVIVKGLHAS